jgi:hypothetical protein
VGKETVSAKERDILKVISPIGTTTLRLTTAVSTMEREISMHSTELIFESYGPKKILPMQW